MKKSLLALAALTAFAGAASAQSSLTVFGVADASGTYLRSDDGRKQYLLTGSGRNASSRLGFRGIEDLGGGLKAGFWLEAGVNMDTGSGQATTQNNQGTGATATLGSYAPSTTNLQGLQGLTFNRRSTVSLISDSLGEVRLGRDYTPIFWNLTIFDPYGTVGVGSATNVALGGLNPYGAGATAAVRSSNSIGYFLPPGLGGVYGQFMVAASEQASGLGSPVEGDGRFMSFRLGYAAGPLDVAYSYGVTRYSQKNVSAAAAVPPLPIAAQPFKGDYKAWNLAGSYNLGFARLMGQYGVQQADGDAASDTGKGNVGKLKHYLLGAVVPVGASEFKVSYNAGKWEKTSGPWEDGSKATQLAGGYVYNFSRRTAFYGTYAILKVTGQNTSASSLGLASTVNANLGDSKTSSGYDIGLRHSF